MSEKLTQDEPLNHVKAFAFKNPKLSIDERVSDLLSQMTLEEKVAQMLCVWGEKQNILCDTEGILKFDNLRSAFKNGIGQIARLSDTCGGRSPLEMADLANSLQKFLVEETRLGIPVIFHEECLHGLAGKAATSYPQPIGLASTFNPSLIEEVFSSIAEEVRTRGAHQALTPVLDVCRDPRWGRVEETFGEDPYLISKLGIALLKGLQGDGDYANKKNIIATLKHFAAHGQPESGSNCGPANFSLRVLLDVYLFPFKEAIQKGNAVSIMASYNEIDGVPSHANKWLLRDILRDQWGFDGYVVSDYYAITELNYRKETIGHSVAKDKKEAALLALLAGVNIEFPDPDCYPHLISLVEEGRIEESMLDELTRPLLKFKFELGLFEDPYVDPKLIQNGERLEKDRQLALQSAQETITLLKNENNLLPLKLDSEKTIAVIGPNADRILLGGYSGKPKFYTSVLQGIKEQFSLGNNGSEEIKNILYSEGCKLTVDGSWDLDEIKLPDPEENKKMIKEAVQTAKKADIVILALGDNEQTSREAWNLDHMGDRTCLELFGMQNQLVEAVVAAGKPVIAVLINGRPISINYIKKNVPAILECWYLGQETGKAIADVIFGNYNPGGKLPISIPRSSGHIPCHYNYKPTARRGYLFDDITPLYPFGFGLSYTTFSISEPKIEKKVIRTNESTKVSVEVKNNGDKQGDEVVQMYIRDLVSSVTRPVKELKGFKKISLKPGETKKVYLDILPEHLSFTDINNKYVVEPGEFEIMIGNSSRDEDLKKIMLQVI